MFKLIIAGGRDFDDYEALCKTCDSLLVNITDEIEIVSGNANGADKLGERYAKDKGYNVTLFKAEWNVFGNSAGYMRNRDMAEYADALIAFWDGKSKGTGHMIDLANKCGIKVRVRRY